MFRYGTVIIPAVLKVLDANYQITQNAQLNATLNYTDPTCFSANNGTITISSPTGGSGSRISIYNQWRNIVVGNYKLCCTGSQNLQCNHARPVGSDLYAHLKRSSCTYRTYLAAGKRFN